VVTASLACAKEASPIRAMTLNTATGKKEVIIKIRLVLDCMFGPPFLIFHCLGN
jgi:hypothetical protein